MITDERSDVTVTYKTQGLLAHPVSDINAAREFLREHGEHMEQYIYPDAAKQQVHSATWDLLDEGRWEVTLVADTNLGQDQLELLSEWISGQNSDGLGEGFEQQSFSERVPEYDDDVEDDEDIIMSSFDWQTNPCKLEPVT